jgi:hypothetical protein
MRRAKLDKVACTADPNDSGREKVIPSVSFKLQIPDTIGGSWVRGQVFVTLKLRSMEASSAFRHALELLRIIQLQGQEKSAVLFVFTEGA